MAREDSSQTELPGASVPEPHNFAKILKRRLKVDRCLQWLEKTPNLKKNIAELPGAATSGPHHFAKILDRGLNADRGLQ